ncbi:MAG: FIST N-terminal domain-containing protein [Solibacillus sp.]
MSFIQSAQTAVKQTERAVEDIVRQLHKEPALILFFSSTIHSFELLTQLFQLKYPSAQIVGVTTTGEIGPDGFSEASLTAQSYGKGFGRLQAVLMDDISKYPIFYRADLIQAAKSIGIQLTKKPAKKDGLAIVFPVGLKAGEEKMLSVVNSIFAYDGFSIFGGTAGDDAKFEATTVSVNGRMTTTGCAVVFMNPSMDFFIKKENIFQGTGKKMKITKADAEKRIVYEIDGKPAAKVYANLIAVAERDLTKHWARYPLGRQFNHDFLIASPFQVREAGAIEFYCQVYEGAVIEVLEPKNPLLEMQKTITEFTNTFSELYGVLGCNCILRKLQFQQENVVQSLNKELKALPNLCGFSSYGEQLNKSQLNQTMLLLGFGKLRAE